MLAVLTMEESPGPRQDVAPIPQRRPNVPWACFPYFNAFTVSTENTT